LEYFSRCSDVEIDQSTTYQKHKEAKGTTFGGDQTPCKIIGLRLKNPIGADASVRAAKSKIQKKKLKVICKTYSRGNCEFPAEDEWQADEQDH